MLARCQKCNHGLKVHPKKPYQHIECAEIVDGQPCQGRYRKIGGKLHEGAAPVPGCDFTIMGHQQYKLYTDARGEWLYHKATNLFLLQQVYGYENKKRKITADEERRIMAHYMQNGDSSAKIAALYNISTAQADYLTRIALAEYQKLAKKTA